MKISIPLPVLATIALAACVAPDAPVPSPTPAFTTGEQAFLDEFRVLQDKRGASAARFVLADVGAPGTARSFSQPIFECSYDEDGWLLGCDRVDEQ